MQLVCRIALVCCAAWVAAAAFAAPVAEVTGLKGAAVLVGEGRTSPLAIGQRIEPGQEIRTLDPGRVKLRFIDGSVVVIGDASALRIENFRASGSGGPREAGFALDRGLISQVISPAPNGSWTVRTPSVVTAVRGTAYIIDVRSDERTEVAVQSGAVVVESSGAARARKLRRTRSIHEAPETPQPVVLDRKDVGTVCTAEGECEASRPWGAERLKSINDRLSGV